MNLTINLPERLHTLAAFRANALGLALFEYLERLVLAEAQAASAKEYAQVFAAKHSAALELEPQEP